MDMAVLLSDLLRSSVLPGTSSTYACGFRSLLDFCSERPSLCAMLVDLITLCGWACCKGRTVKPKTVLKYICGIRHAHLTNGFEWPHSQGPLLRMTITALRKFWPVDDDKLHKVPLSLDMLLSLCAVMPGWPNLDALSFDDLLWATASSIAFFAALRGGEFFTYPGSDRPILLRKRVSSVVNGGRRYIKLKIAAPKTRQASLTQLAFAASPGPGHVFDPVKLWTAFDTRRLSYLPASLSTPAHCPAFSMGDGRPLDRAFMVGRANALREAAGIMVFNSDGDIIPIAAASWRAGFVLSARAMHIDETAIRAVGRWSSAAGPLPYSFDTTDAFQQAAFLIASNSGGPFRPPPTSSSFAGGHFASPSIFELGPRSGGDVGACVQHLP